MKNETNGSRGYEIDIRDLLARLFDKWYIILICFLIGAVIGGLIGVNRNRDQVSRTVSQEDVDNARALLSEEAAEHIESLYYQYLSYSDYRNSLEKYLSESLYSSDEFTDSIILVSVYYVDSSVIAGADRVLELLSLDTSDCEKIAQILGMDSINQDDIYHRVSVSGVSAADPSLAEDLSGKDNASSQAADNRAELTSGKLLQIWVVADTKEQAEEITEVVEQSFDRCLEQLQKIDENISLTLLGQKYSADVYQFLSERQSNAAADLHEASYQVYRLKVEYINELDPEEKELFYAMKSRDEQNVIPASKVSLKKYCLFGAIIGLILGCVLVLLQYLLNGRIKTARELTERYGMEVPNIIYQKQKRFRLFGGVIRGLEGADFSDEAIRRQMAASDIVIKLEKEGWHSVCLVCDQVTAAEQQLAQELKAGIEEKGREIDIQLLDPLKGVKELESFSSSDAVVVVAQLKKSRLKVVKKWAQLCERYELPVAGAVALEEC